MTPNKAAFPPTRFLIYIERQGSALSEWGREGGRERGGGEGGCVHERERAREGEREHQVPRIGSTIHTLSGSEWHTEALLR